MLKNTVFNRNGIALPKIRLCVGMAELAQK
jgi:hypothetical protein